MARCLLSSVLAVSLLCGAATPVFAALNSFNVGSEVVLAQHDRPTVAAATKIVGGQLVEAAATRRLPLAATRAEYTDQRPGVSTAFAVVARERHRSYYPRRTDTRTRGRASGDGDVPH